MNAVVIFKECLSCRCRLLSEHRRPVVLLSVAPCRRWPLYPPPNLRSARRPYRNSRRTYFKWVR